MNAGDGQFYVGTLRQDGYGDLYIEVPAEARERNASEEYPFAAHWIEPVEPGDDRLRDYLNPESMTAAELDGEIARYMAAARTAWDAGSRVGDQGFDMPNRVARELVAERESRPEPPGQTAGPGEGALELPFAEAAAAPEPEPVRPGPRGRNVPVGTCNPVIGSCRPSPRQVVATSRSPSPKSLI